MKIDCHMHVNGRRQKWGWDDNDRIIEAADKLGIDQLCASIPVMQRIPTMDEVCECNDDVLAEDLKPNEFENAFSLRPKTQWMILNGLVFDGKRLPADAHLLIGISRMTSVLQRSIPILIGTAGAQHLAFGTMMPFKTPKPTLLKLEILDASQEREKIAWRNAAEMLGLKV